MTAIADVIVVGAGPAGLATAAQAERLGLSATVLEREDTPGGLLRSVRRQGFTFDLSGHLLHLQDQEVLDLVRVDEEWLEVERRSACWVDGTLVPYPFQQHLAHATDRVRRDCLAGLPDEPSSKDWSSQDSLADWLKAELGEGIAKHFMTPYNEKLTTASVDELSCQALGRFLPRPSLDEIRRGAESRTEVLVGYNRAFLYPRRGGIDLLAERLVAHCSDIRLGHEVVGLDPRGLAVELADGTSLTARVGVVSTAPLTSLATWVADPALTAAVDRLRHNSVWCVNVGVPVSQHPFVGQQWIYLPGPETHAYRVGFYDEIAAAMAPVGHHAMYVEISHNGELDESTAVEQALSDLRHLGVLGSQQDPTVVCPVLIPVAYVIQDLAHAQATAEAHRRLNHLGILSIGRYGVWEYSSMEDAMKQGIAAAHTLANQP